MTVAVAAAAGDAEHDAPSSSPRSADEQAVEIVRSRLADAERKQVDAATIARFLRATGGKIDLVSRRADPSARGVPGRSEQPGHNLNLHMPPRRAADRHPAAGHHRVARQAPAGQDRLHRLQGQPQVSPPGQRRLQ
jgi:hypothetical protein